MGGVRLTGRSAERVRRFARSSRLSPPYSPTSVFCDRGRVDFFGSCAADAADFQGPGARELDDLTKYVCGLSYLNELDHEFVDAKPPEVRLSEVRESLGTLLKGGAITLEPSCRSE